MKTEHKREEPQGRMWGHGSPYRTKRAEQIAQAGESVFILFYNPLSGEPRQPVAFNALKD